MSLHPGLVSFDVDSDDGAYVGRNHDGTVAPAEVSTLAALTQLEQAEDAQARADVAKAHDTYRNARTAITGATGARPTATA